MPMKIDCVVNGCRNGRGFDVPRLACTSCLHPRDREETGGLRLLVVIDRLVTDARKARVDN